LVKDALVKYMVGNSRMQRGVSGLPTDDAKGWKNDVPRHVYVHIVESFLFVMQAEIETTSNFNPQDYIGEGGYAPFSVEEFNGVISESYVHFVTNGDERQKPIVFHTTQSKRNRNLGWYHVFQPSGIAVPTVPTRNVPVIPVEPRIDHRKRPDIFWKTVCNPLDSQDGCQISLRVMVVGHLIVTNHRTIFESGALSDTAIKEIFDTQITPDHKVSDLFGDWQRFLGNVNNMIRYKIVSFRNHPEYPQFPERKRREHRRKVELFREFQMEGVDGDGVNQELQDAIAVALRNGILSEILKLGLKGMNSESVSYLINLHEEFLRRIDNESHLEEQMGLTAEECTTYSQKSAALARAWRDADFIITF
jgi:hypothetical protein